jgi:hypothetical protein
MFGMSSLLFDLAGFAQKPICVNDPRRFAAAKQVKELL